VQQQQVQQVQQQQEQRRVQQQRRVQPELLRRVQQQVRRRVQQQRRVQPELLRRVQVQQPAGQQELLRRVQVQQPAGQQEQRQAPLQVQAQLRSRRHSRQPPWRGSMTSRASIGPASSSRLRQTHCASCEWFVHQRRQRQTQQPTRLPIC